ncbi:MAG: hypothetical protein GX685_05390 [Clostridiales bacterium]|nr:hypothetical protein [Clostridiales bacterium]
MKHRPTLQKSSMRSIAAMSFSTVLELMKEYPEYIFMSSQPQLYSYVKEDHPEIYSGIEERVKEGRYQRAA